MNESQAIAKMVAPGTRRPGKFREGVIQIWTTRACDNACFGCTQGSNLGGNPGMITPKQFEQAVISLKGYFGVVGVFGGNPAVHPKFTELCAILAEHIPFEQRGLWCNNPMTLDKAKVMRETFNPRVSNLNVHLNQDAYNLFKKGWPESMPFGLKQDSRHSPVHLAMKDVVRRKCTECDGKGLSQTHDKDGDFQYCSKCNGKGQVYDEERAWELISNCDVNQHWSAMIGVFRNELRAWFCEVAGAQAMLHQWDTKWIDDVLHPVLPRDSPEYTYPDTGVPFTTNHFPDINGDLRLVTGFQWWQLPMSSFRNQVKKHCHECGVPLRGYGELAMADKTGGDYVHGKAIEQTSETHKGIFKPKTRGREVELVTSLEQLGTGRIAKVIDYMGNAAR